MQRVVYLRTSKGGCKCGSMGADTRAPAGSERFSHRCRVVFKVLRDKRMFRMQTKTRQPWWTARVQPESVLCPNR